MIDLDSKPIRSGMVAIVGPPNAGKSTLMNGLLEQKISIVSPKPQTTRNRILGIMNGPEYQIVLLDTPGLHKAREPLNQEMVRIALESLHEVDAVLYMIDVSLPLPEKLKAEKGEELAGYMEQVSCPVILVLNKVDLLNKEKLLAMIQAYADFFPFHAVIPMSALHGDGTDRLLAELLQVLPVGPRYYPEDIPTDATERFLVAEIIREKVFLLTGEEIPYSTAVLIESFKEDPAKGLITIHGAIVLERESQKGIVIGKGGLKLKSIGTAARKDIERLLDQKVLLKLFVKVRKNWSRDEKFLKELGF
ncbi:MAG: GTP-binding protein [Desulfobulbaceae bacterium]|jgi:GTP-binding protein Era|nr:MAG: GTP-binding protein [Desulfobulbaceae bacterium]